MIPEKISLENLKKRMRIFLNFPGVEDSLQQGVSKIVRRIMLSKAQNGGRPPLDVLTDYLDAGSDYEQRLQFIIGLSGGSLERIKRVYEAMFPGKSFSLIRHDKKIRRRVAAFLINPKAEKKTFIPPFVGESFFLPDDWIQLLQNEEYLRAVARNLLQSKYAVRMGVALEKAVCEVVAACGVKWEKGPVEMVDNKEVDIAIPSLAAPEILIMSSYQLTTSSSQSSKANEQARMYQEVQTRNRQRRKRGRPETLFINVIDGGGWLARANDLDSMRRECDYCFAHSGLGDLKSVITGHLQKHNTRGKKP